MIDYILAINIDLNFNYVIFTIYNRKMKGLFIGVLAALASFAVADDCPESKQITCVDDVRAAYAPCKKAAETGGSDICMIAHTEHMDIKGC